MVRNLIFFIIIFVNVFFTSFFQKKELVEDKTIIITPGMKLKEIAEDLYNSGIIDNKQIFIIWTRINLSEKKLKFGEYFFEEKVSVSDTLKKLTEGESLHRKLTIVEGWSKNDLLIHLNRLNLDEGLALGDIPNNIIANTYFYQVTDNPKKIIEDIKLISKKIAKSVWNNRDETIPLRNPSEMFILASIVEKETSLKKEKAIISGVFYNRFKENMRLQSDPTVVYAITLGKKKMHRKLLRKDLKFQSEFNTYVKKGLPPSPICFPGIESLKGVANPYRSNFLYFVSKKTNGGHFFSSNYKDHLRNIESAKKLKRNEE
ncbi:MAG: endolytic transglycosylase MltG [Pseudomonadota bacterium]|nr:endolytic transglycosylase MltG [Pseudomonadota bacterium]